MPFPRARGLLFLSLALCAVTACGAEARLYLQLGHSDHVTAVSFSPDDRWALTGGDTTARLWDVASGREIRRFQGHSSRVTSVAFSPDGRLALTGSWDATARLWDIATGRQIRQFQGHAKALYAVAFSPDGHLALTGSSDATARLWDVPSGKEIRRLEAHAGEVNAVAFSPDGHRAVTGDRNTTALWDLSTGQEIWHTEFDPKVEVLNAAISSVAFSPDGRWVLTGSENSQVRLRDAATGSEIRSMAGHEGYQINAVAFSPDGRSAMTTGDDDHARLWDTSTGKQIADFAAGTHGVQSIAFAHNGRTVLVGCSDHVALLLDLQTRRVTGRLEGHAWGIDAVAVSPDGRLVLTASWDHTPRLWNMTGGVEVRRLQGHSERVTAIAFSRDSRWALTGSEDKTARLWDVATGKAILSLEGHSGWISAVAFSPDSRCAVTAGEDKTLRLWDLTSGKQIRRLGEPAWINAIAFSSDGRHVLTGSSDETARLWDISTGQLIHTLQGHSGNIDSVSFSPDGRLGLTGSGDRTARLWDLTTGKEIRRLEGHSGGVHSAAFSPDGTLVMTGSDDNTARVWEAATGKEIRRLEGHSDAIESVAFTADARFALTGSTDGTTRLWDTAAGKWVAILASFTEGGWAVVDPEGRYDASDPDSSPGLHFVAGSDVIDLGQLKQRFYTPGLLGRIWRRQPLPEIAASLKDVKLVPGVVVQPPAPGTMEATVHLRNRSGGIGKVTVKVNGRELPGAGRGAIPDPAARSTDLKLNLAGATLSPTGNNVIEVFAENGDGVIRSRGIAIPWHRAQPAESPPPKLFAIVAGVSAYDAPGMNLRYAAKDAADFGHAIELAARGLFGKERTQIILLASGSSPEPTKENIQRAFERVAGEARGSDVLIIYFAGHGAAASSERDQYYYFTKEARSTEIDRDPNLRAVSTVSSAELKRWLERTNMPLKQVIVLDTCAAGAAFGDMVKLADRRDLSPDQIRAIELLKDSTGSWILMGSAADAVSYEANRYAQGLLTYALLEGMQGAALEEDRVEVSKLFGFAQRQVEDLARGIGGIQKPVLCAPKGQTFPIGLLREEDRKQIHVATLKPQLLRARVHDDDDLDPLRLEPALRAALRAASLPVTRGADQMEPQIVYLDAVVDEVPDALIPQVRYTLAGATVKVRLRLVRNGKPAVERNLELPAGDAGALSAQILPAIISLSEELNRSI